MQHTSGAGPIRRVIRKAPQVRSGETTERQDVAAASTKAVPESRLRVRRSPRLIQAMARLDAGTHVTDPKWLEEILAAIQEEFPEPELQDTLIGIVSRCYLGEPYEVHTLDLKHAVIEHYKHSEPLPAELERVRALALHPAYEWIEVFHYHACAVSADGEVAVIPLGP